jgi:hypothetical protein
VGRTPWSARDAHVPLLSRRIKSLHFPDKPTRGSAADRESAPQFVQFPKWENHATLGSWAAARPPVKTSAIALRRPAWSSPIVNIHAA